MENAWVEVIYENVSGLKVYFLAEDGSYAVIDGDEELEEINLAVTFDDVLNILKRDDQLPGRGVAGLTLAKKRNIYEMRKLDKKRII